MRTTFAVALFVALSESSCCCDPSGYKSAPTAHEPTAIEKKAASMTAADDAKLKKTLADMQAAGFFRKIEYVDKHATMTVTAAWYGMDLDDKKGLAHLALVSAMRRDPKADSVQLVDVRTGKRIGWYLENPMTGEYQLDMD